MYFCKKSKLGLGDTAGDIHRVTIGDIAGDITRDVQRIKRMRIGHHIYNYLYDYTDSGTISLSGGIVLPDSDYCIMGAYINYDENQVYVVLEDHTHNVVNKTIHQFVCQMGGANSNSYMPLYELRDTLRTYAKQQRKKYKQLRKQFNTQEYEG